MHALPSFIFRTFGKEWCYGKSVRLLEKIGLYDFRDKATCNREYIMQFLRRTNQMFEYEGLPDTIPKEYLELYMQYNGYVGIFRTSGNLYATFGGLGGELDEYYQPTTFVVANPYLKFEKTLKINQDCIIIRNDIFMQGLLPIMRRYSTALVENDISLDMVSKNMRSLVMFTAPTDPLKASAQKVIDDINDGKQSVAADSAFLEGIKMFPMQSAHGNAITDLIEYHQYLRGGFYNEIGLNANYNMKREKLNDGETALNQDSLLPLIDEMLSEREKGVERVNALFGTSISVRLSDIWQNVREKQAEQDEPSEDSERSEEKDGDSDDVSNDSE